jgi:hypothetical protein
MAHFLGLSPVGFILLKIMLTLFWVVGIFIFMPLQHFIAAECIKPKAFGTTRQKLHFWLIIALGGFYLFLIPFLRMKPDVEESVGWMSPS